MPEDELDVVVVAPDGDPQAQAVLEVLANLGASTARFCLDDFRSTRQVAQAGSLDLELDGGWRRATCQTSVWWHRTGTVNVDGLDAEEARLLQDEAIHLLRGALLGASSRFVDDPFAVDRAETKEYQLAVARRLGIRHPRTIVTDVPQLVRDFTHGERIIAKPVSPGVGIAPYVAEPRQEDLDKLTNAPTLIQNLIDARADLRVVVVAGNGWVWKRPRDHDTIDWRRVDPEGAAFRLVDDADLVHSARRLTSALGLTTSVQDWLDAGDGPVFLETNPQGRWLFLEGAADRVPRALAHHLIGTSSSPGEWPKPRVRLLSDFMTMKHAPANDGVIAPEFPRPSWIYDVADYPQALELAQRARTAAEDSAKTAEEKAGRLVQLCLAVLTLSLALGAYQTSFALTRSLPWLLTLVPVGSGLVMLVLAAFEAQQVDRVGVYRHPAASDLEGTAVRDRCAVLLEIEDHGRELALWSSRNKHTDLMQARAWFSRGLAAVILSAVLAASARAITPAPTAQQTRARAGVPHSIHPKAPSRSAQ